MKTSVQKHRIATGSNKLLCAKGERGRRNKSTPKAQRGVRSGPVHSQLLQPLPSPSWQRGDFRTWRVCLQTRETSGPINQDFLSISSEHLISIIRWNRTASGPRAVFRRSPKLLGFFISASCCSSFAFSFPLFISRSTKPCLYFLFGCAASSFLICCYFWLPSKLCMILIAISQNHNHPQNSPNISRRKSQELLPRTEELVLWISAPCCQHCPQPLEPKNLSIIQLAQSQEGRGRIWAMGTPVATLVMARKR